MNELLSGFELDSEFRDFIVYLLEEQVEERLWEIWIHKDIEDSFDDFKKKSKKKVAKRALTKKEEDEIMRKAEEILNIKIESEVSVD